MRAQGDDESWDAVIVGAGMGGLVCAAYLAAAGRRVLVLEQHDIAGGNSHVFRRRRRYEFDVGVHYIGDCGAGGLLPAIFAGVGAADRVRFREMDPDGYDELVLPSRTVRVPRGRDNFAARLRQALPDESDRLATYLDIMTTVADETRWAMLTASEPSRTELSANCATLARWSRCTLTELFDHCGLSVMARTLIAAQGLNFGMGPDQIPAWLHAAVTDHYLRGSYYPVGGGQTLGATLVEVLEANGGQLRTRAVVESISVEGGRTTGVRFADGSVVRSDLVVSNADYSRTVLELVGAEHFPPSLVHRTRHAELALPMAITYVALDTELPRSNNANVIWHHSDDITETYRELATGDWDEVPMLFISFSSIKDPDSRSVCPAGHTNLQIMTLCPQGYETWQTSDGPTRGKRYRRNPDYLARKRRMTESMLDAAEKVLGPFRDHIVHLETATPLTQERYTRSTRGDSFGMTRWGDQLSRPDVRTTVDGLYVVGQNTRYGTGIAGVAISGLAAASRILGRRLLPEVLSGAVIGDPGLLPERGPGWDPLRVCRGVARRNAKGMAKVSGVRAGSHV